MVEREVFASVAPGNRLFVFKSLVGETYRELAIRAHRQKIQDETPSSINAANAMRQTLLKEKDQE